MQKISILKTKHAESVTLSSDGTKAYIADGTSGLVIADISNPTHPVSYTHLTLPTRMVV